MLAKDLHILKSNQYSYDKEAFSLALLPQKAPYTTIIKRYQIDYSFEQKYKLGILTGAEYMAWQAQLYEESLKQQNEKKNHTFWENDESVRENVSQADYDTFLSVNDLDVSNNAMVDIDAIIRESQEKLAVQETAGEMDPSGDTFAGSGDDSAPAETASAAAPLPGDDDPNRVLTPDEIAALFAAMGTGG